MKLFLQACGIEDAFCLRVEDRSRSESYQMVFQRPYVIIGRTTDSDLTLDHWQVSRRHAYLQVVEGRLFCLDLGSRTGTHWEGRPSRWRWLSPRQAIQIGPYRIWCDAYPSESSADSRDGESPPTVSSQLPEVSLVSLDGEGEGPWNLTDPLSLMGRSQVCQIRLSDPTLSKFHASLVRTALGVWIVDLFGTGGIAVNQTRLRAARLNHGDEITIGEHRLRLEYADPNAFPTLIDEERIEPVGSAIAKYDSPVNHQWVPTNNNTMGYPATVHNPGFVMGGATNPNLPESVAIAQALLGPMLNQFAMMQQQMFEQFHQSMMMMMQSMHIMHRERMDSVDKELAEVRRLTQELHALQAEAARLQAAEAAKAQAAATAPAPPSAPTPPTAPRPSAPRQAPPQGQGTGTANPPRTPVPSGQNPLAPPRQQQPQQQQPQRQTPAAAQGSSSPTRPPAPPSSSVPPRQPEAVRQPSAAKPAQPKPQVDVHSVLQQRINNLQNERQSRWQKILGMVGAGGGGGDTH